MWAGRVGAQRREEQHCDTTERLDGSTDLGLSFGGKNNIIKGLRHDKEFGLDGSINFLIMEANEEF